MLRDIKAGKPVEACTRAPAIGSYLHKKAGRCDLLCLCGPVICHANGSGDGDQAELEGRPE